ncbi:uncharacterized protein LY89DRAFT_720527 [Mollisia scopiformis]|uniref:Transcription initiation factor IIF subunit alpha n=1 Tax=Mollisia scopiformis TaxID=149040 RepID=A0A194X1T2_MOLSC|nr:uncharacterized protein LY89DRAFT_720527 [Mollisia scopiformis]KUJ14160.1 hypothetical protein LY89DRAFT_720527 [Mollisia scopiformis]
MSASPSGLSNGQTPTPNGGPPQYIRKAKAADPLRPRKKPVKRLQPPQKGSIIKPNGLKPAGRPPNQIPRNGIAPASNGQLPTLVNSSGLVAEPGGWTNPPTGEYMDFPLFTTKRALREGLRYHVARFSSKKDVDPSNQEEFTRPVVLHRRDPKQPAPGKGMKDEDMMPEGPIDSKERERQEILKAEKEKQRAADLAQIAPTGNNASAMAAKKNQAFRNEKTTQVYRLDKTAEQKKASDLRYEEALPWHLEDADNKNTWVGNYEAALSDTNVIFFIDGDKFKMIPVEKWYKFTAKAQFKTLTLEEVEAQMNKKYVAPRWMPEKAAEIKSQGGGGAHKLFTVKSESNTFKNSTKRETEDMDDLDFAEDDLFQDDDEQVTMEPDNDEETKDAQERIKREQLGANVFDQANEADVDMEFLKEEKEAEEQKKLSKGVKKMLKKREQTHLYDSDSDHPYSSSSEDFTSDEEKLNEQDKKKEEEAKAKAKEDAKLASGTSSKGTNTPSGRPKHTDPLKKKNLKRPGSPNRSESSGNESSRKKIKKKHSSQPISATSAPGSRQISPAPSGSGSVRKSSIVKLSVNSSKLSDIQSAPPNPSPTTAMSDGEATGGEMSDGGTKKTKIKLRIGGTSPTGSRAGSPAPGRSAGGSRAGSPANQPQSGTAGSPLAQSPGSGPIQPHEIVAALPAAGIKIGELMKIFQRRVGDTKGQTDKKEFIRLVKENAAFGPDKLLRPK